MTNVKVNRSGLCSTLCIAGIGFSSLALSCSSEQGRQETRAATEQTARTRSKLLAEAGSLDTADATSLGDELVVKTGVGYFTGPGEYYQSPGFCFFTRVRGGFADDGDYAVIRQSGAPDFVWEIAVRSARASVELPGPQVSFGCVLFEQFPVYTTGVATLRHDYVEATAGGPSTGATMYSPDPLEGVVASDGVFVLSKLSGSIGPVVRAQACTTTAFGGSPGAVQVDKSNYGASGCDFSDPYGTCSLTAGAWNHVFDSSYPANWGFSYAAARRKQRSLHSYRDCRERSSLHPKPRQ